MKKFIVLIICLLAIGLSTIYSKKISTFISDKISNNQKLIEKEKNEYAKSEGFLFVDFDEDYIPYSYNDILNVIYTIINNGWDSYTFYCPSEYKSCIKDIESISNDNVILTHINNFVHPYNSFNQLSTSISATGEISIKVSHVYNDEQIKKIDTEIDRIMNNNISGSTTTDKIRSVHDYIINNTKYDQEKDSKGNSKYDSSTANGVLFDHYATCNGYTDTMAIFLTKLGVTNYKIATTSEDMKSSSTGHVWNAAYVDNKWLHIDLTWDDPVTNTGEDVIHHNYFLVNTNGLKQADQGEVNIEEHNFRKNIYLEFNEKANSIK